MSKDELKLKVLRAIRTWHSTFASCEGMTETTIRGRVFPGLAPCEDIQRVITQLETAGKIVQVEQDGLEQGEPAKYMLTIKGMEEIEEAGL